MRASAFLRNTNIVEQAANCMVDAINGDFDSALDKVADSNSPRKKELLRNRVKVDASSCLL